MCILNFTSILTFDLIWKKIFAPGNGEGLGPLPPPFSTALLKYKMQFTEIYCMAKVY